MSDDVGEIQFKRHYDTNTLEILKADPRIYVNCTFFHENSDTKYLEIDGPPEVGKICIFKDDYGHNYTYKIVAHYYNQCVWTLEWPD